MDNLEAILKKMKNWIMKSVFQANGKLPTQQIIGYIACILIRVIVFNKLVYSDELRYDIEISPIETRFLSGHCKYLPTSLLDPN